jgi:S-DNA-T family DNA segregation ATPase FtsK/SpoIIIE
VPRIASLPELVDPTSLPVEIEGRPVLGIWDETLQPVGFDPTGVFLVAGAPQSGKSNTVAWLVRSLLRCQPTHRFALFGTRRSTLVGAVDWDHRALTPDDMEDLATELTQLVTDDDPSTQGLVVVIESIGELLNGPADLPLQDLVKACRTMDRFVIAEGETSTIGSSWPLLQAVKSNRYGIAMQPEQIDGDNIFKTAFPRMNRAEYPQGRGLFVRSGRLARVQVPLVE